MEIQKINKICNRCDEDKSTDEFYKHKRHKDGLSTLCKKCTKVSVKKYQDENKIIINEKQRKFYKNNSDRIKQDVKDWHKRNPDWQKNYDLQRTYGITLEQYNELVKEQNGLCAICKKPKKLHVDHNHKTSKVRKLLCGSCNTAIGLLNEDTEIMKNCIEYLVIYADNN